MADDPAAVAALITRSGRRGSSTGPARQLHLPSISAG
jgi:hypothetical protein